MQKRNAADDTRFTRTTGYVDCLDSASNDKLMMRWFKQMTEMQIQEGVRIPELEVVKRAMGMCFSGAENTEDIAQFEYKVKTQEIEITYQKDGKKEKLPMRMLSDGLKITISMVADIAYRMAVLNPQLLDNILEETPGIVLIDEVDMHLHPEWQKRIMADLHYIFPKVQFVVTTHSPSVLANVRKEHILLLEDGQIYMPEQATYGRDISAIMQQMMKVEIRPEKVLNIIGEFYKLLSEEEYGRAKELLGELEGILGSEDADVVQAKIAYDLEQI